MRSCFTLSLLSIAASAARLSGVDGLTAQQMQDFQAYTAKHGKHYADSQEFSMRARQFARTDAEVRAWNAKPNKTHTKGLNQFSDWTIEEKKSYNRLQKPSNMSLQSQPATKLDTTNLPGHVSWYPDYVNPVKDQGYCGSCYAHATNASMETGYFFKTGKLLSFSEQQIVDCGPQSSYYYALLGCGGGWPEFAFKYTNEQPLEEISAYPYTSGESGYEGNCQYDASKGLAASGGAQTIQSYSTSQMKAAIALGVVTIALDATPLYEYSGGVMSTADCPFVEFNHGVNAVGYNSEANPPYFVMRNSWTTAWGEEGYFRLEMTADGTEGPCGFMGVDNSYPVLNLLSKTSKYLPAYPGGTSSATDTDANTPGNLVPVDDPTNDSTGAAEAAQDDSTLAPVNPTNDVHPEALETDTSNGGSSIWMYICFGLIAGIGGYAAFQAGKKSGKAEADKEGYQRATTN